jgi:hypothetical protein
LNDATPRPTSWAFEPSAPTIASAPIGGSDDLCGDVSGYFLPGKLSGDGQPERDRRIDVVAGYVPERVHGCDDDGAEREGDDAEIRHREWCIPVDDQVAGTAPTPMKTSNAVPSTSAANFCGLVFSSMTTPKVLLDSSAESRRVFDNVE